MQKLQLDALQKSGPVNLTELRLDVVFDVSELFSVAQ